MNIERLQKVSDYLRKLNPKKFDLRVYTNYPFLYNKDNFPTDILNDNHCGTIACVIGHFPNIFPEDWEYNDTFPVPKEDIYEGICNQSCFYLDIELDLWVYLFTKTAYPDNDPISVAERIDYAILNHIVKKCWPL